MTAADLIAWERRLGFTHRQGAAALGVALKTYQEMRRGEAFDTGMARPIDRRTALACLATEILGGAVDEALAEMLALSDER